MHLFFDRVEAMNKILIIDDDATLRSLLADWLTLEGFQVLLAANGFAGIQLAKQQQPDLILCDVKMPIMNGYDVLRKVREHPSTVHIPFFFLTAEVGMNHFYAVFYLKADGFLRKPIEIDELRQVLASLGKLQKVERLYD